MIVWLVSLPMLVLGQGNLVPNGDFENYSSCGINNGMFYLTLAVPWNSSGPICSPDYFNQCASEPGSANPYASVPSNSRGYQHARSGVAYGGFFAYSTNSNSGREFVQVELTEPIVAGVRYEVVFHVSLADEFRYAVSTLGAHFSETQIVRTEYSIADLGLVPQVNSAPGMVFDDKENWVEVRDTFDSRYGGERFITIGNFNLDSGSGVVYVGSTNHNATHAYYYIDDVSVIALDSIPNSIVETERLSFSVYPNPAADVIRIVGVEQLRHLRLADLRGREVMTEEVSGHDHSLKIGHLPRGLYILEVTATDGRRATQRVIKMAGP
jgi:OmpA-OmpF porin, OOP family